MKYDEHFNNEWKRQKLKLSKFELVNLLIAALRNVLHLQKELWVVEEVEKRISVQDLVLLKKEQMN